MPPGTHHRNRTHRLEDGAVEPHVAAGRHPKPSDQPGTQVRQDVSIQVRHHQHVVLGRVLHHVETHSVQVALLELDVGVPLGDHTAAVEEGAVRQTPGAGGGKWSGVYRHGRGYMVNTRRSAPTRIRNIGKYYKYW